MRLLGILLLTGTLLMGCSETNTETNPSPNNDQSNQSQNQTASNDNGSNNGTSGSTSNNAHLSSSTNGDSQTASNSSSDGGSNGSSSTDNSANNGGGSSSNGTGNTAGESNNPSSCAPTDVGIAFQAINATVISDANAAPSKLVDGCIDRDHSWSGDYGSIVTLDAGAVHQMQGIYIWSTFARMEWLKIESSADGLNWTTDWHAVPSKPVSGPVYYGLAQAGSTRYVRITGFGSHVNNWTNLAEVRWSLAGYNVGGERVYRRETNSWLTETAGLYALSKHALLEVTAVNAGATVAIRSTQSCQGGLKPVFVDARGRLEGEYWQRLDINSRPVYLLDWDNYVRTDTDNGYVGTESTIGPHGDYLAYSEANRDPNQFCNSSGPADASYGFNDYINHGDREGYPTDAWH